MAMWRTEAMSHAVWKPSAEGVMLYVPSEDATNATRLGLSRLSVSEESESFPPQKQNEPRTTTKPTCEQKLRFPKPPSSFSSESSRDDVLTPASSSNTATGVDIMEQLRAFITPSSNPSPSLDPEACFHSEEFTPNGSSAYQYDSDGTDFLIPETPCPQRAQESSVPRILSGPMSNTVVPLKKASTIKRPSWLQKRSPKSKNVLSLENLRDMERHSPPHKWTSSERELLAVLFRWYHDIDHSIPKAFRAITGLELPDRRIRQQYTNYMRLYGLKAFPELASVQTVPFDDPAGHYNDIRTLIDVEAVMSGIPLRKRSSESHSPLGWAANSKSELVRKHLRHLVLKASQHEHQSVLQAISTSKASLGGYAIQIDPKLNDETEVLIDIESTDPSSTASSSASSPASFQASPNPVLGFRTWSEDSYTAFREGEGFIAPMFAPLSGGVTRALPRNDEYGLFDVLATSHLSKKGGGSTFVSVATSLLQTINLMSKKTAPKCAIIDLSSPVLNEEHKMHRGREIVRHLKENGEMSWARYQGLQEYIIWGKIPSEAILNVLEFSDLQLAEADPDVGRLLNLGLFDGKRKTSVVSRLLQAKHIALNAATARAMAKIAVLFGLGQHKTTNASHLAEFVACLVDGWHITGGPADIHSMAEIARHFAMTMNSHHISLQDIMSAFLDGVKRGEENIVRFGSRRSRAKSLQST